MQNKKRPEQPAHPMRSADPRRSGQLVRVTGRPHTGEEWKACRDEAAIDGGDRNESRQACSRSHYQTGRVRLPGVSGLEGTDQPGRRRANARYVRKRASFGSLQFHGDKFGKATIVNVGDPATLRSFDSAHPVTGRDRTPAPHSLRRLVTDTDIGCEVSNSWP
jgi:hypothetical protein